MLLVITFIFATIILIAMTMTLVIAVVFFAMSEFTVRFLVVMNIVIGPVALLVTVFVFIAVVPILTTSVILAILLVLAVSVYLTAIVLPIRSIFLVRAMMLTILKVIVTVRFVMMANDLRMLGVTHVSEMILLLASERLGSRQHVDLVCQGRS